MTHLQTIHTNLLVYVVQIPIKYLRLMVLTFMIFATAIDMYELETKTILDNRYKFVKKKRFLFHYHYIELQWFIINIGFLSYSIVWI